MKNSFQQSGAISREVFQKHIEYQSKSIIFQDEKGNKIETPTVSILSVLLTEDEKVVISITTLPESKQFTVKNRVETGQGETRPISLGKEYLKVIFPTDNVKPNTLVLQLVDGNKGEIEFLASRLIVQGVTPDKFEPKSKLHVHNLLL